MNRRRLGPEAMQQVLVSDTSVLIDLKRGSLLEASFRLAFRFVVPDLLYERELKNWGQFSFEDVSTK